MSEQSQNEVKVNSGLARFLEFFEIHGWSYDPRFEKGVIMSHFDGQFGRWRCVAMGSDKDSSMTFMSLLPCKAPKHRREACAELLARINYKLMHGCFEMDFEDGEIRFRTSFALGSEQPTPELVEHLVFSNLYAVDRHFGAVMNVVYGSMPPKLAIENPLSQPISAERVQYN